MPTPLRLSDAMRCAAAPENSFWDLANALLVPPYERDGLFARLRRRRSRAAWPGAACGGGGALVSANQASKDGRNELVVKRRAACRRAFCELPARLQVRCLLFPYPSGLPLFAVSSGCQGNHQRLVCGVRGDGHHHAWRPKAPGDGADSLRFGLALPSAPRDVLVGHAKDGLENFQQFFRRGPFWVDYGVLNFAVKELLVPHQRFKRGEFLRRFYCQAGRQASRPPHGGVSRVTHEVDAPLEAGLVAQQHWPPISHGEWAALLFGHAKWK